MPAKKTTRQEVPTRYVLFADGEPCDGEILDGDQELAEAIGEYVLENGSLEGLEVFEKTDLGFEIDGK